MPKLFSTRPVWREKFKEFKGAEAVYVQGEPPRALMYIQSGGVKLTVV